MDFWFSLNLFIMYDFSITYESPTEAFTARQTCTSPAFGLVVRWYYYIRLYCMRSVFGFYFYFLNYTPTALSKIYKIFFYRYWVLHVCIANTRIIIIIIHDLLIMRCICFSAVKSLLKLTYYNINIIYIYIISGTAQ
jgi:hypothetical protein